MVLVVFQHCRIGLLRVELVEPNDEASQILDKSLGHVNFALVLLGIVAGCHQVQELWQQLLQGSLLILTYNVNHQW